MEFSEPVAKSELNSFCQTNNIVLPKALRKLCTEATSSCHIGYDIEAEGEELFTGGLYLPSYEQVPRALQSAQAWGDGMVDEKASLAWLNSLPLLDVGNGDMVGLDLSGGKHSNAVRYLCHEGQYFRPLSDSFEEFLIHWERIGYVSLDYWDL